MRVGTMRSNSPLALLTRLGTGLQDKTQDILMFRIRQRHKVSNLS